MNNQTSWIAASLFIGFVVYITIRGELPAYKAAILGGSGAAVTTTATTKPSDTAPGQKYGDNL